jgi:aminoglycoside N3'-acetyltransferase
MELSARTQLSVSDVVSQLRALGVTPGDVLQVHTSFRALRPVEKGPQGLIEALWRAVGPAGTLVMPSWSDHDEVPFDPATSAAAPDLVVVADVFWRIPGVLRSHHPFAFAAAGPHAARITADPLPLPPHIPESPVGRVHELDGKVLLLGVNHDADTTLHLAEILANVPYGVPKRCTVLEDGKPVRIDYEENDHCCRLFELADKWLRVRGLQSDGPVGHGHARVARARDIVDVALQHLRDDPLVFLHHPDACAECRLAHMSIRNAGNYEPLRPRA